MLENREWKVKKEINFRDRLLVNGTPQFGFHTFNGERYVLDYNQHFIGKIGCDNTLEWSIGPTQLGVSKLHIKQDIKNPKFVSKSFSRDVIIFGDDNYIYEFDCDKIELVKLISKEYSDIEDIGNCVFDRSDNIWVNDVKGNRVFRFNSSGVLIDILGSREPGFQSGTVTFDEVKFNWNYDLRLGTNNSLYLLDSKNFSIREINIKDRTVSTVCGDGSAGIIEENVLGINAKLGGNSNEYFDGPWAIDIDELGNIIIGDTQNKAIRMLECNTGLIKTLIQDGVSGVKLEKICSLDYFKGKLYIPDWRNDASNTLVIATKL